MFTKRLVYFYKLRDVFQERQRNLWTEQTRDASLRRKQQTSWSARCYFLNDPEGNLETFFSCFHRVKITRVDVWWVFPDRRAGGARLWESWPLTKCGPGSNPRPGVIRGWVCCWFFPLLRAFFTGFSGFPPSTKTNTPNAIEFIKGLPYFVANKLFIWRFYFAYFGRYLKTNVRTCSIWFNCIICNLWWR